MGVNIDTSNKIKVNKVSQDTFLFRHTVEFEVDRPVQAWQWMNQTRCVPDHVDWVRAEVSDAWRRCLDDYQLPLGNYMNWELHSSVMSPLFENSHLASNIGKIISQLSENFHTFLKEADVTLILTAADGELLSVIGEQKLPSAFLRRMYREGANWSESVLGNNGIGSAAVIKKPVAFQGMEHFLNVLHPFTTVGYPLFDEHGKLLAVVGLVSDYQEQMKALFAFLHLICVLVNTHLPSAQNQVVQKRVLEKIHVSPMKKTPPSSDDSTSSEALELLVKKAVKLQTYKIPILVTGESGVGKDHFVRLLKKVGPRKDAPLIAINCASIPRDLIESELFGYESGSFTGAKSGGKVGKFLQADKGILFLDEIGDMSFDLQATLLRVLESSEFTPVGGSKPIRVDVHIVAATNVDLAKAVEAGRFRRDLYYRLNGAQIHLLPLRSRADKISIIHSILQRELNTISPNGEIEISSEVLHLIENHPWPGNIRQLISVIRATLYTSSSAFITLNDLPFDFLSELHQVGIEPNAIRASVEVADHAAMSLMEWECHAIKAALKCCGGNISLAAKKLGITRTTLYKKMADFDLR
jgi:transcriptional regulator of acetoin/glycerol metabolism